MNKKTLGIFALAMINVAAIMSLRNFPLMATYGLSAVAFYVIAALTYFIPTALVCAELATALPKSGGEFRWVSAGLNPKWGFYAIWSSWMGAVAFFPALLTFMASMVAYMINPEWVHHKGIMLTVMLGLFWFATFINFFGVNLSSRISSLGAIIGTLIPGGLIVGLAAYWVLEGYPLAIDIEHAHWLPDFKWDNLVFYTGVLLGFVGLEMSAYHAQDAKNPQKDYPKAILLSAFVILGLSVVGTLAVATVVPSKEINILEGLMQTYQIFLRHFQLEQYVPLFAGLIVLGALSGISTWILGPAKGISAAAEAGFLPEWFQKTNQFGAPVGALIAQLVLGTLLSSALVLMPNIETAYWILNVLSAQFALLMYILVFIAAILLRVKEPELKRPYQVPGGFLGLCAISIIGILSCAFAFLIGFIPPGQLSTGSVLMYDGYLVLCLVALFVPAMMSSRAPQK